MSGAVAAAEKQLICERCHREWSVPLTRGRYPRRCRECDPKAAAHRDAERARRAGIRKGVPQRQPRPAFQRLWRKGRPIARTGRDVLERHAELEAEVRRREQAKIDARREAEAQRERERQQRAHDARLDRMRRKRERDLIAKRAKETEQRIAAIASDDRQAMRLPELLEVSERAAHLGNLRPRDLAAFVRRVGLARGTTGTRNALIDLAAAVLAAAAAVPDAQIRELDPDAALWEEGYRPRKAPKVCAVCGATFTEYSHSRVKTCSRECLSEAGRRNAAKRKTHGNQWTRRLPPASTPTR